MARKGFNFINSFRNVFRRKHSNVQPQVEAEESKRTVRRKKESKPQFKYRKKTPSYKFGGCNDRGLGAIYYKPSRGKFKGYMREAS